MNMMQMVGIMVLCYFTSILVLSLMHKHINTRLGNTIFIIADLVFFFFWFCVVVFLVVVLFREEVFLLLPEVVFSAKTFTPYCRM